VSYTSMSQVRYGAESGVHAAANYLMYTYAVPAAANAADPLAAFNINVSPVTWNGAEVILSSDPSVASNYPVTAVRDAFVQNSVGTLAVNGAPVAHAARARLMAMSTVTDYYTGQPITLQRWEIIGVGRIVGSGASVVEVEATIERQPVPVFSYAAFATHDGCNALSFAGGATTHSYDSTNLALGPADTGGNVGTNGNLDGNGGPTDINGTLSTPRSGVGNCTANNVTAATVSGWATVEEGLVPLPQPVVLSTPTVPNPGVTDYSFTSGSGCSGSPYCVMLPAGSPPALKPTIIPPPNTVVSMRDITMNGTAEVHLRAGTYALNTLKVNGGAKIVIDSGPVIIDIKGDGTDNTPLDLEGGGVSNPSMNPQNLQFVYGGDKNIKITGGTDTAALIYAPNASASLSGAQTNFYGAIVTKYITATGGFDLFYDRNLMRSVMTGGRPTMTSFTWRTF
jgi:hypothetical protein